MSYKVILLLCLALVINQVHPYFQPVHEDVDWFLFWNKKQDIQWYIFDTANIVNYIIYMYLIHSLCKPLGGGVRIFTGTFLAIEIKELVEYWLFADQLNNLLDIIIIVGVIVYLIIYHPEALKPNVE